MPSSRRRSSVEDLIRIAAEYDAQGRDPNLVYTDASGPGALSRVLASLRRRDAMQRKRAPPADPKAAAAFRDGLMRGLGVAPAAPPKPYLGPRMKHR